MTIRQRGDYQFASSVDRSGDVQASVWHEGRLVGTLQASPQRHIPNIGRNYAFARPDGQGELFRTRPGELDMLAVSPEHQGQGIARGMMNTVLNRVGTAVPSDELTPDSAGLLGHMGINHATASLMMDKGRRDSWAENLLWSRENHLNPDQADGYSSRDHHESDTLRDETAAASTVPAQLASASPPPPPVSPGQFPGQRKMF
jgi:GNAT superfamily N-acetyltransferase